MENSKSVVLPVTLKGGENYLLWSRTAKAVLCGRGLWRHVEPATTHLGETTTAVAVADEVKRFQEDQAVLAILQSSLDISVLEAYSYCEKAKELWDTLKNVFGNASNLIRVFEVKRAINNLSQEDMEFNKFFGKFRSLWAELEMLRPPTTDAVVLNERREQDKVFALLMVLNPVYNDLIKHLLRAEKLPSLDEVCSQIQKEQGSLGLFGGKGELVVANKGELATANKSYFKPGERKPFVCDHCKRPGHLKDRCYLLHPHLNPNPGPSKWKDQRDWRDKRDRREPRANLSYDASPSIESAGCSVQVRGEALVRTPEEGTAMAASSTEYVKKADLDALIKALKESGNAFQTLKLPKPL
uniref:Retrotransposon Copia-like N-terminal domain-containing protein n=1 Tax=Noccaea caerulescens TaxID=107243 RepID=A0A1J3FEB5_NOCCA